MSAFVLGIDIGGTGSRVALAELHEVGEPVITATLSGPRVGVGAGGSNVLLVARRLVSAAREAWSQRFESVIGIGVGATGISSLVDDPGGMLVEISGKAEIPTAVAIDAVTAHLGALGGNGGAVSVLGTGAIAIAHPGPDDHGVMAPSWCRVDGWGHLFGDRGGGAWLGRRALEHALCAHDGVDSTGRPLLDAAIRRFGPPASWPSQFYTREDRAGLLAEFVMDVADLVRDGDPIATQLLSDAGRAAARSALAAASQFASGDGTASETASLKPNPCTIALTGGLVQAGAVLIDGFREEAARIRSDVELVDVAGDPMSGALRLAELAAGGKIDTQDSVIWT